MGCESWKLSAILLSLISLLASVRAQHDCMSNGPNEGYKSNSPYGANLKTLLSSLSHYVSDKGFHHASFGNNEDRVNALVLCRGDQTVDQCRSCVQAASDALPRLCPEQKQAIIWYESCMLRYSNKSILGTLTNDPGYSSIPSSESVPSPDELRAARTRLSDVLRDQAAADGMSGLKVGAGTTTALDSGILYGLMQCTPDLSPDQCDNCLKRAAEITCCDSAPAISVVMPSCNLRFRFYPFYNVTRLRELQVPLSEVPVPSPPGMTVKNTRSGKTDDNTTKVVIIIVVAVAVCITLGACAAVFQRKRMNRRPSEIAETTNEISTVDSLQYDFSKIRAATNDFAVVNKLGQGGFGAVYRGKLLNDQDIAVKRLAKDSRQGNVEFKNEVLLVAKLQHRNLVRLLGFSLEETERVLIYEFAQNGSLDRFIFDRTKRSYLNWDKRYKIIEGIARGLMYLHEDSRLKIIHRDLKASNILLDGNMNPKIADFGLARLFERDETQGHTNKIAGTYGYMAPEYAMHGHFSIKSDVFSFGVLVLEILSGQRNNYIQNEENVGDLLTSTWKNWQEGTAANMIDSVLLTNDMGSLHEMLRCIHMGLLCVQENAAYRPTMTSVVSLLISPAMVLPVPSKPAFYMASRRGSGVPLINQVDSKELKFKTGISKGVSQNYLSVTELHPR